MLELRKSSQNDSAFTGRQWVDWSLERDRTLLHLLVEMGRACITISLMCIDITWGLIVYALFHFHFSMQISLAWNVTSNMFISHLSMLSSECNAVPMYIADQGVVAREEGIASQCPAMRVLGKVICRLSSVPQFCACLPNLSHFSWRQLVSLWVTFSVNYWVDISTSYVAVCQSSVLKVQCFSPGPPFLR